MATFNLDQPYPIPGLIPVKFGLEVVATNWVRLWVTDAPVGSKLRAKLDDASARGDVSRVVAYDGPLSETWPETFEVGGVYTFQVQEYTFGASAHGGGYKGDPDSWPAEAKNGAEATRRLYVGERLKCQIGSPSYGTATLVLWVWQTTIRATTVDAHGEKTPALASVQNERARTAALDTTVATKVAALLDKTATVVLGNLDALCGDMRGKIPGHFNNNGGTYHGTVVGGAVPDTDNDTAIEQLPAAPMTPAGYIQFAQVCRNSLANHMANEPGASAAAPAIYHQGGGVGSITPDYEHVLAAIPPGAVNMATARAALADVVRAHNAHIDSAAGTYHEAQDLANPIVVGLTEVDDLHQAFLDAVRKQSPTAPTTVNPAVTALVHGAGFEVIPPGIIPPGIKVV